MRLGISGWRLIGSNLGVARYTQYLIKHWIDMLGEEDKLTLYLPASPGPGKFLASRCQYEEKILRPKLTNALWENILLPRYTDEMDVLFGPSYTLPLWYKGKSVVAIHSVNEAVQGVHSLKYRLTYSQKYRLSCNKADIVIANSESTRDRVRDYYRIPEEKIRVIWLGVDEAFRPSDDVKLSRETKMRYLGADCPYILLVGGLSDRRNIPMLITAFGNLKRRYQLAHKLLLLGPNRGEFSVRELAVKAGVADSVIHADIHFDSHDEIVPVYSAADLYVLPSTTEGFSLTLAEAMACGIPVIAANSSSLGEVAQGYTYTIDELTVESLADAMHRVLTDKKLNTELREKGLQRAQNLRWENTARETLSVLRSVALNQV